MKKLKIDENTKIAYWEDDIEEKQRKRKFKTWLENNKIYFEVFSFVIVGVAGIVISFIGLKFNRTTIDIYKKQLEIAESDKKPRFSIKGDYLSASNAQIESDGKKIKCYYNIANKGEDITEVSLSPDSYIFFCIPTDIEKEYYIFKFYSHDFWVAGGRGIETVEKDKEYRFAEYIIEETETSEWAEIAKRVSKYYPDMKCVHKNIVNICYTDYIGEKREEFFVFDDRDIKREYEEEGVVLIEDDYGIDGDFDSPKQVMQVVEDSAKEIIKQINEWLEKNKGARGYKIPDGTRFEYLG